MPSAAVVAVRDLLAGVAGDRTLDDAARVRALQSIRDDLADLVGQADTYLGDTDLRREAAALNRRDRLAEARENADLRDAAVKRGIATPDQMDAMGYYSHDDLDRLQQDGTLWEALEEARQRRDPDLEAIAQEAV